MQIKIYDSELKVMEVLWARGVLTAGQIAAIMKEQIDWNRNTTYTVIGKLVDKGAVKRFGDNFSCEALIQKEDVQKYETQELIDKYFDGCVETFLQISFGDRMTILQKMQKVDISERLANLQKSRLLMGAAPLNVDAE